MMESPSGHVNSNIEERTTSTIFNRQDITFDSNMTKQNVQSLEHMIYGRLKEVNDTFMKQEKLRVSSLGMENAEFESFILHMLSSENNYQRPSELSSIFKLKVCKRWFLYRIH